MAAHPYLPESLEFDGYQPISTSYETILSVFFSASGLVLLLLLLIARRSKLSFGDSLVVAWLGFSGLTHMLVEGPVVANGNFYKEQSDSPFMHFMNDLWKEYGKADSRYLTRDACTIGIEGITAFVEGPLCMLCILGFVTRSTWRHILTMLVVCGELYGTVLYFYTSWHEGLIHHRPEPFYWWFYFCFMNSMWIVFPILIIYYLSKQVCEAVQIAERKKML